MNVIKNNKYFMNKLFITFLFTLVMLIVKSQTTQIITGNVSDGETNTPINFATIVVKVNEFVLVGQTDSVGNYLVKNVPVGKADIY